MLVKGEESLLTILPSLQGLTNSAVSSVLIQRWTPFPLTIYKWKILNWYKSFKLNLFFCFSLSRYKLKFSPDKVDTMVIQAICLLDELDKELNNYIMRCREWYGWHFPELGKLISDNTVFVKTVKIIGKYINSWIFLIIGWLRSLFCH